ncbi:MAG: tRNA (adenosine(37)-N6)-threonylcarbamoyltransferase complex ATPase subunit type 1 TsaE [Thermodesulfobacteriota bacterium]
MVISINLTSILHTYKLGQLVAQEVLLKPGLTTLLLRGDLGSGKTTFVRGLVAALPGGEEAEVASPSFNLVNIYPTRPEVVHMDLYRLRGSEAGELFEEYAEAAPPDGTGPGRILAVEWAEHLPDACRADDHLTLSWRREGTGRTVAIETGDEIGAALVSALAEFFGESGGSPDRAD